MPSLSSAVLPPVDPAAYEGLQALVIEAQRWVIAAAMAMARPVGVLLIMPVFTRAEFGVVLRLAVAFALALPVLGYSQHSLARPVPGLAADIQVVYLALLALKELFVGLLVGFVLGIPVWSIQAAGELIDVQRGVSGDTGASDPATRAQASAFGVFLGLSAITVLVAAGGLNTLADALYASYGLWPIRGFLPSADLDAMMGLARLVDRLLRTAFTVAGPVIALMLLLDICVMLVGRFAPQLNLNDLAPTLKNVCVMLFLIAYANYLFAYIGAEVGEVRGLSARLGDFLR